MVVFNEKSADKITELPKHKRESGHSPNWKWVTIIAKETKFKVLK